MISLRRLLKLPILFICPNMYLLDLGRVYIKIIYLPVIQSSIVEEEDDSELDVVEKKVYTFKMVNIDSTMEINPKFLGVRDQDRDYLKVDLITTFSQKDERGTESSIEEEDVYAVELKKLQEAPLIRIKNRNERLNKKFKHIKSKLVKEERELENITKSVDSIEDAMRQTKDSIIIIESNLKSFEIHFSSDIVHMLLLKLIWNYLGFASKDFQIFICFIFAYFNI